MELAAKKPEEIGASNEEKNENKKRIPVHTAVPCPNITHARLNNHVAPHPN
jgi:hypothetical protein